MVNSYGLLGTVKANYHEDLSRQVIEEIIYLEVVTIWVLLRAVSDRPEIFLHWLNQ